MTLRKITGLSVLGIVLGFGACTVQTTSKDSDGDGGQGGQPSSAGGDNSNGGDQSSGDSGTSGDTSSAGSEEAAAGSTAAGSSGASGGSESAAGGGAVGGAGGDESNGGASSGETSAGAGGDTSAGGTGGATTPTGSDTCDNSDVEPNDDRNNATPYEIGSEFEGCLQSSEDVDFYEFSVPDDDRGGVVTVRITDVGPNGDTDVALWAAADNGEFHSTGTNTEGASVFFFFNAKPGATFRLEVTNYVDLRDPNPYLLTVTYDQVPDEYEPNDTRPEAAPIEVGQAVEGYEFAGWENSTGVPEEDWYDWYAIELEPGDTSFLMDVVASDVDASIELFDPLGSEIASEGTNTEGSTVVLEYTVEEAGTYFLRLRPYVPPGTKGNTVDPPEYATTPYTLTVTQ